MEVVLRSGERPEYFSEWGCNFARTDFRSAYGREPADDRELLVYMRRLIDAYVAKRAAKEAALTHPRPAANVDEDVDVTTPTGPAPVAFGLTWRWHYHQDRGGFRYGWWCGEDVTPQWRLAWSLRRPELRAVGFGRWQAIGFAVFLPKFSPRRTISRERVGAVVTAVEAAVADEQARIAAGGNPKRRPRRTTGSGGLPAPDSF